MITAKFGECLHNRCLHLIAIVCIHYLFSYYCSQIAFIWVIIIPSLINLVNYQSKNKILKFVNVALAGLAFVFSATSLQIITADMLYTYCDGSISSQLLLFACPFILFVASFLTLCVVTDGLNIWGGTNPVDPPLIVSKEYDRMLKMVYKEE